MVDQSQIRQLQTPDNQINVFPITLEKCISDSNGMVLSQKMTTLQSDIATVEPSSTSAHAYAVGDYLMYSSQLYKVTQAISIGDTLTVGANIEATKIVENLSGVVTGVKGDAESAYRTGNVNLTPANLGAVATSKLGVANGVAELDSSGKVKSSQLPSSVDDIVEGYYNTTNGKFYKESTYATEIAGEASVIYLSLDTDKPYRWSGSAFVGIPWGLALGETSSTAYRGDRGKAAYDHSQLTSGNPHNVTKSNIGLGNVVNTGDSATPVSGGTTKFTTGGAYTELAKKQDKLTAKGSATQGVYVDANGALQTMTNTLGKSVPSDAVFTDTNNKVAQTATTTNADYEVLFSSTADNTTRTEGARKNSNFKFNPSTGNLQITKLNGETVGSSPKFTDTTYANKAAASGGTDVSLVTTGEKYTWNQKTSNTGTVTQVSTGAGLTGGSITSSGTIKAKLKSETQSSLTAASKGSTADREYAVGLDADGNLSVNVPWEGGSTGAVTGVKGNAESTYRTGNVNLTPANLGALATNGNSQNCTATFTSSDNASTTDKTSAGFTAVDTMSSGETHASLFQKISKMFLNIRKLWNTVGTELGPVSKIVGDTSVTFSNSAIKTTSELELLCENSTNEVIRYTGVTVSAGSATYTFSALTVATSFYLKVR